MLALALPVMPDLTLCYACTVYDRRQWMHNLWSQERRAGGARRCGSQFPAGLHCLDGLHAAQATRQMSALRRICGALQALGVPLCCYGVYHALHELFELMVCGLFASGGDRAFRADA